MIFISHFPPPISNSECSLGRSKHLCILYAVDDTSSVNTQQSHPVNLPRFLELYLRTFFKSSEHVDLLEKHFQIIDIIKNSCARVTNCFANADSGCARVTSAAGSNCTETRKAVAALTESGSAAGSNCTETRKAVVVCLLVCEFRAVSMNFSAIRFARGKPSY